MLHNALLRFAVIAGAALLAPAAVAGWGEVDLRTLPRDHVKERWVKDLLARFGLQNQIRVVRDRSLEGSNEVCAFATVRYGQQWIAYGADCVGELKPVDAAGGGTVSREVWMSTAVMLHETAHVLSLHSSAPGDKQMWTRQLEAEFFAGFGLFLLSAPLEVAEAYGSAGAKEPSEIMPGRADRIQAVVAGWRQAERSTRHTVAGQRALFPQTPSRQPPEVPSRQRPQGEPPQDAPAAPADLFDRELFLAAALSLLGLGTLAAFSRRPSAAPAARMRRRPSRAAGAAFRSYPRPRSGRFASPSYGY